MPAGQSARIRDIYFYMNAAAAESLILTIDRKSIVQFSAPSGLYLLGQNVAGGYKNICSIIKAAGLFPVIPLAEGETLDMTAPGASNYLEVVYDLYTAEDVKADEPNGSKSNVYRLFQTISNAGVRASAGDLALNQSDLSAVFPAFPGGEVVPANHRMDLLALFGAGSTKGTGAANGEYTTYLKCLKDREDIFDKDLGGITFLGDAAYTTAAVKYQSVASRISAGTQHSTPQIITFDPPISFNSGAELNVYATIGRTGAGADFIAADIKVGMIFDVIKLA
jgi:hypothetical protein